MKFVLPVLAMLLALASQAFGQLNAPKEVEPFEPIIVNCQIAPSKDAEVQISWRTSSDKVKFEELDHGSTLHIWAPPGDYSVEATVAVQTFREILVLVPDPDAPNDTTKAKTERVKVALSFSVNRYTAEFKVKGDVPTPPGPQPPAPNPPGVPSAELQAIVGPIKSIMAGADATKASTWKGAWSDFLIVLPSTPLKTTGELKTAITSFTNAAATKANLQGAFPGFSAALEKAFVARFGAEDATLDPAKASEFIAAVVWACQR